MSLLTTLIFAGLVWGGWTRPILPLPYQVMYLNPDPLGYHFQAPPQPIVSNRLSDDHSYNSNEDDHSYEVTQFHTEDEGGRIVYGFQSPDQVRMEAREADGTVRGSYSYVDAFGNIVKMQYWDDGNGIHMAGNNLPVAFHQEPQYSPEVRAAREEHFRLYDAALASLRAAGLDDSPEPEPEQYPSPEYEENSSNSQSLDEVPEEEAPPSDDSVILENESAGREPNLDYQKMPFVQDTPLNLPSTDENEDEESIAIDNPELVRSGWSRMAKSRGSPHGSAKFEMDAASTDQMALKAPKVEVDELRAMKNEWNADEIGAKALKPEEPQEDKSTVKKVAVELTKPTEIKNIPSKIGGQEDVRQGSSRRLTEEKVEVVPEGRAFFYQFAHQIPQPEERVDEHVEDVPPVLSIQASAPSEVPVADQLTQLQQEQAAQRQESSKLLESPKSVESPHESSPMKHVPQLPEETSQDSPIKSVSQRAVDFGAIPVSAVHDAQLSPRQRHLVPNYQLYPIFVPPIKN